MVCGFTDRADDRKQVGSLLLGVYDDGALIPVTYDAAINEGFKDAGAATPSGVEPIGTPVGGGAGSGGKGSGGSSGGAPTTNNGDVASGGCGCRVSGGDQQANSGVSALAGLLLFGLWVVRRRRPRANS